MSKIMTDEEMIKTLTKEQIWDMWRRQGEELIKAHNENTNLKLEVKGLKSDIQGIYDKLTSLRNDFRFDSVR